MQLTTKVGLAVVTYRRFDILPLCLASLAKFDWGGADVRVVVADELRSDEYDTVMAAFPVAFDFAEHKNVARAKNRALQYMINDGCSHLFLIENDIVMLRADTCLTYMEYAASHGFQHLNAQHEGSYLHNGVCVHRNLLGGFQYFTRGIIERVGFMNEAYHNAWEHCDHTHRIAAAGGTTPQGHYADIPNSGDYVRWLDCPSSIAFYKEAPYTQPVISPGARTIAESNKLAVVPTGPLPVLQILYNADFHYKRFRGIRKRQNRL